MTSRTSSSKYPVIVLGYSTDEIYYYRAPETMTATDYLLVQHPSDRISTSPGRIALGSLGLSMQSVHQPSNKEKHHVLVSV